jgi:hypothetical protein
VKSLHSLRRWRFPILVLLVLLGLMIGGALVSAQSGSVTSSAVPSSAAPEIGDQIAVAIHIDMSNVDPPDHALGSLSASLNWEPGVLAFNSCSGVLAGFTGVVNDTKVSSGRVTFNGANALGATGEVTLLTITFDVVGSGTSVLDLEYSAMAAAHTFNRLLPLLTVYDSQVVLGPEESHTCFLPLISKQPAAEAQRQALGLPSI